MARFASSFVLIACAASLSMSSVSCKKKQVEEVKKEILKTKEILEVPMPDGAVAEVVIKDPESFAARVSKGAGLEPMLGASPWQKLLDSVNDENAKKALKAIDPHGTVAGVALMKFGPQDKPHGVMAARLKDPEIASAALEAAAKAGGQIKAWDSKVLEGKVYEPGEGAQVAVYGDVVLVSDTREALEGAGKYAAWRSSKSKVDHELIARIPMEKLGPELKRLANEQYGKLKPGDIPPKVKAELDPLVPPVTNALTEVGDAYLYVDIDGDNLKVDESVATKGSLTAWLAKVPSGDASPLLSMPKSESVAFYRFGDGLGPLIYSLMDWGLDTSPLSTADRAEASKQVRALGKSLGHLVAYSTDSGKGGAAPGATPSVNTEVFVRLDLDDAAGAKGAIASLRKLVDKAMATKKPTATPYKKLGAEGETLATPAMIPGFGATAATATKDTWTYAIKGSQLFVDLCLGCTPSQVDAALDPAAKATLADDPIAKAKIGEMPGKGVVSASYGTALSLPGLSGGMGGLLGAAPAPKKPGTPMWGYSQITESGVIAKGVMPMILLGDLAKTLLAVGMMGGPGGGMGGMGGPPPPF
jgi:hypothetical protein